MLTVRITLKSLSGVRSSAYPWPHQFTATSKWLILPVEAPRALTEPAFTCPLFVTPDVPDEAVRMFPLLLVGRGVRLSLSPDDLDLMAGRISGGGSGGGEGACFLCFGGGGEVYFFFVAFVCFEEALVWWPPVISFLVLLVSYSSVASSVDASWSA